MNIATLTLLNETTLRCLNETNEKKIIGIFTELTVNILEADFGFVWMSKKNHTFELAYTSQALPYTPLPPKRTGRNTKVFNNSKPDFVSVVQKRKDKYDVSKYMKSFVIIPIVYQDNIYGNIIMCFKKRESFSKEKRLSCTLIGSNIAHVLTILRNKVAEKENEEYQRRIAEEELKTEFLADAIQEIRTPIATIKSTVDLVLKPRYPLNQLTAIKSIKSEIEHLSAILFELSLMTLKNSSIKKNIQIQEMKLAPFMSKILKRWILLANKKSMTVHMEKIPSVSILADEVYLNKLFTNIVKNAVSNGKDMGHISISATLQGNMVKIDIHDDGVGISRDDLENAFEKIHKGSKPDSYSTKHQEKGLSLAITKWIAEAHGGSVAVKSILGKESNFSVLLPYIEN